MATNGEATPIYLCVKLVVCPFFSASFTTKNIGKMNIKRETTKRRNWD